MAIKHYNPVTPGQRKKSTLVNEEITKSTPEKSLLAKMNKRSGRNNQGKITVRHQGGGEKRKYRIIDFKRNKFDIEGTVASIEYDPNRSANIALINYVDGEKRYIIAPKGLKVGNKVISGENVDIKVGNTLPLKILFFNSWHLTSDIFFVSISTKIGVTLIPASFINVSNI